MLKLIEFMLAVYRLASDIAIEHGPFGIYANLRRRVKKYVEAEVDKTDLELKDHHLYWLWDGIDCPICLSFWVAFIVFLLPRKLRTPLAAAGGVKLLYEFGRINR